MRLAGRDRDQATRSGMLRNLSPGHTVKVVVDRGGKSQTLAVTVAER